MEAQVKQLQTLTGAVAEKQPSPMPHGYDDYHTKKEICRLLGITVAQLDHFKALCAVSEKRGHGWIEDCFKKLAGCETVCDTVKRDCLNLDSIVRHFCCPGNSPYSPFTIDQYSDNNQLKLKTIVQDFGPGFVNAYSVPPGAAIRLEHRPRPGFVATKLAVDLALANNGNNYLDIEIQFYLGPGGQVKGTEYGPAYDANQFLNKDGTQIHLEFPSYRGRPLLVGSLERLAVEVRHTGGVNNIISCTPIVYHDAKCWWDLCKTPDPC